MCDILENMIIWVALLPRVAQKTELMPNFWRAVYIQFNGCIFKQIIGIPMSGNASPFIADLYLSWCEFCYMTKIVKTDYAMAKLLSYNIYNIWMIFVQ